MDLISPFVNGVTMTIGYLSVRRPIIKTLLIPKQISANKRTARRPEEVVTMSRNNLTALKNRIVAEILVVQMHTHMVQHCQGLHARIVNDSSIATKLMEMDRNLDEMVRILQSSTPSA